MPFPGDILAVQVGEVDGWVPVIAAAVVTRGEEADTLAVLGHDLDDAELALLDPAAAEAITLAALEAAQGVYDAALADWVAAESPGFGVEFDAKESAALDLSDAAAAEDSALSDLADAQGVVDAAQGAVDDQVVVLAGAVAAVIAARRGFADAVAQAALVLGETRGYEPPSVAARLADLCGVLAVRLSPRA